MLAAAPGADVDLFERNLLRVSPDDRLQRSFAVTTLPDGTVGVPVAARRRRGPRARPADADVRPLVGLPGVRLRPHVRRQRAGRLRAGPRRPVDQEDRADPVAQDRGHRRERGHRPADEPRGPGVRRPVALRVPQAHAEDQRALRPGARAARLHRPVARHPAQAVRHGLARRGRRGRQGGGRAPRLPRRDHVLGDRHARDDLRVLPADPLPDVADRPPPQRHGQPADRAAPARPRRAAAPARAPSWPGAGW